MGAWKLMTYLAYFILIYLDLYYHIIASHIINKLKNLIFMFPEYKNA